MTTGGLPSLICDQLDTTWGTMWLKTQAGRKGEADTPTSHWKKRLEGRGPRWAVSGQEHVCQVSSTQQGLNGGICPKQARCRTRFQLLSIRIASQETPAVGRGPGVSQCTGSPNRQKASGIPAGSSLGEAVLAKLLLNAIVTLGASISKTQNALPGVAGFPPLWE